MARSARSSNIRARSRRSWALGIGARPCAVPITNHMGLAILSSSLRLLNSSCGDYGRIPARLRNCEAQIALADAANDSLTQHAKGRGRGVTIVAWFDLNLRVTYSPMPSARPCSDELQSHMLGRFCYRCLRVGHVTVGGGRSLARTTLKGN